jgi:hypothetical protein
MQNNAQFIMLESKAYYNMITEITKIVEEKIKSESKEDWIEEKEAMQLLGISSKSTLQKFRDEDRIKFSAITSKTIKYSKKSILQYIESKSNKA